MGSVDYNWGAKQEDGSWDGMVGMILRDEADIAVSSFFATKERGEVVDFSVIMEYAEYEQYQN